MHQSNLTGLWTVIFWLSVLPIRVLLFGVGCLGLLFSLPIQIVVWVICGGSFWRTLPYGLFISLAFLSEDVAGAVFASP